MTPIQQFQRYVWLVDTLYSCGPLTKEEIDHKWRDTSVNTKHTDSIPERTFRRDMKAIESIFNIDYTCDRATNRYHIDTNLKDKSFSQWAVKTMAMSQFVLECKDIRKQILIEEMPSGIHFLSPIVRTMKEGHALSVTYQSYFADEASTFEIEPYCLKSFKRRWYVLAKSSKHDEVRVFSLDRFQKMTLTNRSYTLPRNFDGEKYFSDYYGVILNRKVDTIVLRVSNLRAKYLCSLPLHHTQKVVRTDEQYTWLEFNVAPTFDFIQELRSLGNEVKVESPLYLRDELLYDYRTSQDLYNDN